MVTWRKTELTMWDGQWGHGTVFGGPSGDAGVYAITSPFGPRDPLNTPNGQTNGFHQGLDIGYPEGVPLVALFDAVISCVSTEQENPAYGNFIVYTPAGLDVDADGWVQVWYGHLRDVAVTQGQTVNAGDLIGHVGQTGMASGPHLHLEVRNRWGCIDPFNALMAGGLRNAPASEYEASPQYQPLTRAEVAVLVSGGANYVDLGPATPAVVVFTK